MPSKYVDVTSMIQVIGSCFLQPQLLDFTDKYTITEDDFPDKFYQVIFGSIYKLHESGATKITIENISDFLATRPTYKAVFDNNKGPEWLQKAAQTATPSAFDYYYNRMKKFSLLRAYDNIGVDVSFIYNVDMITMDIKKRQLQEDYLDNTRIEIISDLVEKKIEEIKLKYVDNASNEAILAATGMRELVERLKKQPDYGVPMYGSLVNTVFRGAGLKMFYLRSSGTNVGKSRTMIADACYIACDYYYDNNFGWIKCGNKQPTLYIGTEQEIDEIQRMMIAFLSGVNEDHIITGKYEPGEEERIMKAIEIFESSPLYIEILPDFSMRDVENMIVKNIREHDILYVFFDYVHSSLKILEEIGGRSGGIKLREDNILFMLTAHLKDIALKYGVFILSSTQLSGDFRDSENPDQSLLRGAKSQADRVDAGYHILQVTNRDLEALEPILSTNAFERPTLKYAIYKNRRSKYKLIYLWCKSDMGVCRVDPMFCTTYNYELVQLNDTKINVEKESAF